MAKVTKVRRARDVAEHVRDAMEAEALSLVFHPRINVGSQDVISAIDLALRANGDQLRKISIEYADGKSTTVVADKAVDLLKSKGDFAVFQTIAESEIGNRRDNWQSAAFAYNSSPSCKTLIFGLPRSDSDQSFAAHVVLLRELCSRHVEPSYGFGYRREYGLGPGQYGLGMIFKTSDRVVDSIDIERVGTWLMETSGDREKFPKRHRYERGMILDVFPINVLTDQHLEQRIDELSFRDWILNTTGAASLTQVGERCYVWRVEAASTTRLSALLDAAGLIIATSPKRVH